MSIITILIVAIVVIVIGSIVYNYVCNKEDDNLPVKHIPTNGLTGPSYPISKEEFTKMEEYKAKEKETIEVPCEHNTDENWSKTDTSEQAICEAKERVKNTKKTASKSTVKKTKPKTTKKTTTTKKSSGNKTITKSSK